MPEQGFEPTLLAAIQLAIKHDFADAALLEQALTHRSYVHEVAAEVPDNERLEFLGDAVLELAVSHWLFESWPDTPEGQLTQMRARIVNARTLAGLARQLNLGALLRLGVGEERTGGRTRRSLLADSMEALLGAVFLDGGFEAAQRVVRRLFTGRVRQLGEGPRKDPKSRLQEWTQALLRVTPSYRLVGIEGPDHEAQFEAEVTVADRLRARGVGTSKKEAERAAAQAALARLEEDPAVLHGPGEAG